ncbi:MAG: S8 family serine peptidase [Caldilineales bacterium]|nr:S8 family serine peptidase [Caldilineales bacterium]
MIRLSFTFLSILFLLLATVPASVGAPPTPRPPKLGLASDTRIPHSRDHVSVRLHGGAEAAAALPGAAHLFGDWYRLPVLAGEAPAQALQRLAAQEEVALVELDYTLHVDFQPRPAPASPASAQLLPNDPRFPEQWHFPLIQAPAAWEIGAGAGVTVAVVDSGISKGEDLQCHTFVHEYNIFTRQTGPGVAVDDYGHGTHVAGTIAQCTDNGLGVAGLAFAAQLMPVKVLNQVGNGTFQGVAEGVDWARSHGARVINLSLGGRCFGQLWPACSSSVLNAALSAAAAADIVIVAAAGNFNESTVAQPGNHPDAIAVAGVDFFGARGWYSSQGSALGLSAPGGDLRQDLDGDGLPGEGGILQETFEQGRWGYYHIEGTSMAAAHVSGVAALLRAHRPQATRQQVRAALQSSALDLGAAGFDTTFGHGLLQAAAALVAIDALVPTLTPTPTPSDTPTPTPTPTATPSATPTLTTTPTLTPSPSSTPTPTPTPTPTDSPPPAAHLWLPLVWRGQAQVWLLDIRP